MENNRTLEQGGNPLLQLFVKNSPYFRNNYLLQYGGSGGRPPAKGAEGGCDSSRICFLQRRLGDIAAGACRDRQDNN